MSASVARQKCNPLILECPDYEGIRRAAERSINGDLVNILQLWHLIEAAASDDADLCCSGIRHSLLLPLFATADCAQLSPFFNQPTQGLIGIVIEEA